MTISPDIKAEAKDIERKLVLAMKYADKNVATAFRMVGNEMANHAKTQHRFRNRTGNLVNSISFGEVEGKLSTGDLSADFMAGGLGVSYAASLEYGHKAYTVSAPGKNPEPSPPGVVPPPRKALRWWAGGQPRFAKSVRIPAKAGEGFMAKAVEAKLGMLEEQITDALTLSFIQAGFDV